MKQHLIHALQKRAKKALKQHKPTIIAITGSVGKTSTKNAIEVVLQDSVSLRSAKKNFNNEIGVPLAILGKESPGRSIIGWLKLLLAPVPKEFPRVLLLEFGADHPGDIKKLVELAPPNISVVTGISTVHAEFFENIEELIEEKAEIVKSLPADARVILNSDDAHVSEMRHKTKAQVTTYGIKSMDVSMENLRIIGRTDDSFEPGEQMAQTTARVLVDDANIGNFNLKDVVGYAPALSALAGIAVGREFDINPADAIERLNRGLQAVPGRLRPLPGIKGSMILDDSYNAAPAAMRNGLDVLKIFHPGEEHDRRIAALGSMAELGQYSKDEHHLIGMKVAEVADVFIAVGEAMRTAVEAAKEAGMKPEAIEWFETSEKAGRYLDSHIQQGDIVYVKGSQSTRMEKVVKDVMAEPLRAKELLVRQEEKWLT